MSEPVSDEVFLDWLHRAVEMSKREGTGVIYPEEYVPEIPRRREGTGVSSELHEHVWRNVTGSKWRECACGMREKRPADEQGVPLDWDHDDARVYGNRLLHSFNPPVEKR